MNDLEEIYAEMEKSDKKRIENTSLRFILKHREKPGCTVFERFVTTTDYDELKDYLSRGGYNNPDDTFERFELVGVEVI